MRRFILFLKASVSSSASSTTSAASSATSAASSAADAPSAVLKAAPHLMSSLAIKEEENYGACRAIIPVLQAEEAERFVEEWRKYLDEEARIMKNVPGWKDGQPELEYRENLRAIKEEKYAACIAIIPVLQAEMDERAMKEEKYAACRAIIPVLQAEMDERFVKGRMKYLDEVARIMKDDPGWKVGPSVYNSGRWMPTATGELRPDVCCPFAPLGSAAVGARSVGGFGARIYNNVGWRGGFNAAGSSVRSVGGFGAGICNNVGWRGGGFNAAGSSVRHYYTYNIKDELDFYHSRKEIKDDLESPKVVKIREVFNLWRRKKNPLVLFQGGFVEVAFVSLNKRRKKRGFLGFKGGPKVHASEVWLKPTR